MDENKIATPKKEYVSPVLEEYGDLIDFTQNAGTFGDDLVVGTRDTP